MKATSSFNFHPIMNYSGSLASIDLTNGYDHSPGAQELRGAGGYLERRKNMYISSLFGGNRFIHMGIDIWAPAGSAVFAFDDGFIWGFRNNDKPLDYGGTIITEHKVNGYPLFALHGHLSLRSLDGLKKGMRFKKGDQIAELGNRSENGGWIPHLHFQLSINEPTEPDMPGVVSEEELANAVVNYPDPRIVLGPIYL